MEKSGRWPYNPSLEARWRPRIDRILRGLPGSERRQRTDRLETRVTAEQKALITRAAALEGRSITDFVLTSVQDAAKRAIAEHEMIQLSAHDARAFAEALIEPREPSRRMKERVAAFGTRMSPDGA